MEREDDEDACESAWLVQVILAGAVSSSLVAQWADAVFGGALKLLRRVCPERLAAEWWVSTCAEIDVKSVYLTVLVAMLGQTKLLDSSVLASASWLRPMLAEGESLVKMNAEAGLSGRETMCHLPIVGAFSVIEVGGRVESHAASLVEPGVLEALDYACVNDFTFFGISTSSYLSLIHI